MKKKVLIIATLLLAFIMLFAMNTTVMADKIQELEECENCKETHNCKKGECKCGNNCVAQVITKEGVVSCYDSINAAVNSANTGDTVLLLQDIKDKITPSTNGKDKDNSDAKRVTRNAETPATFIFDLNGHQISFQPETTGAAVFAIKDGSKVTFQDSSNGKGKIEHTNQGTALAIFDGEATIKSGNYVSSGSTTAGYAAIHVGDTSEGKLTVEGGKIQGKDYAINGANGNITISGGEVTSDNTAIVLTGDNSKLDITGGTVKGKEYAINEGEQDEGQTPKNYTITISGGEITSENYGISLIGEKPTLVVSGGTITAKSFAISGNGSGTTNSTITISGGNVTSTDTAAIYHPNTGTLTVKGTATVKGKVGIVARQGEVDIEGGKVIGTGTGSGQVGDAKEGSDNVDIPFGAAIVVDNKSNGYSDKAKVNISDGILNSVGEDTSPVMSYEGKDQENDQGNTTDFAISGGEFSSPFNAELITGNAAEVSIEKSGDTRYYVGKTAEKAVSNAEVGSHVKVEKGTLEIASLPSGVTVEGSVTVTNPSSSGDTVDTIKNNLTALVAKAEGEENVSAELTNAINTAKAVLANAGSTYSDLKDAYEKLQQAYDAFKNGGIVSDNQPSKNPSEGKDKGLDTTPKTGDSIIEVTAVLAVLILSNMIYFKMTKRSRR